MGRLAQQLEDRRCRHGSIAGETPRQAIGSWDYCGGGAPLTIITLAIGTRWLWL
jgi:hypothetical protein